MRAKPLAKLADLIAALGRPVSGTWVGQPAPFSTVRGTRGGALLERLLRIVLSDDAPSGAGLKRDLAAAAAYAKHPPAIPPILVQGATYHHQIALSQLRAEASATSRRRRGKPPNR